MATAGVGIVSLKPVAEAIAAEAAQRPVAVIMVAAEQCAAAAEQCAPAAEPAQTAALHMERLVPARLMLRPMRRLRIAAVVVDMRVAAVDMLAAVTDTGNR